MTDLKVTVEKRRDAGEWRPAFLAMLRNSGNIRLSCDAAGVSRKTAYAHREADPGFRKQWDEALDEACDLLEAAARMRALMGSDTMLIFLLKSHRREVYGDQLNIQVTIRKEARRLADELGLDVDEVLAEVDRMFAEQR